MHTSSMKLNCMCDCVCCVRKSQEWKLAIYMLQSGRRFFKGMSNWIKQSTIKDKSETETAVLTQLTQRALTFPSAWLNLRKISSSLWAPDLPFLRTITLGNVWLQIPSLPLWNINFFLPTSSQFYNPGKLSLLTISELYLLNVKTERNGNTIFQYLIPRVGA